MNYSYCIVAGRCIPTAFWTPMQTLYRTRKSVADCIKAIGWRSALCPNNSVDEFIQINFNMSFCVPVVCALLVVCSLVVIRLWTTRMISFRRIHALPGSVRFDESFLRFTKTSWFRSAWDCFERREWAKLVNRLFLLQTGHTATVRPR